MDSDVKIREYGQGDPSKAVYFYFRIFEKQFNFIGAVEEYFIKNMAELWDDIDKNMLWIAEKDGEIVGTVMIVRKSDTTAQLRYFAVDESVQGQQLGTELLKIAMGFCRDNGYKHVFLWTIDVCESAKHLYHKFGFRQTETKPNNRWARYPLVEERWDFSET
ncbi:MAG: GNAT family N-acetyltransferase [Clostridia bacterium]|nr:GNAT family N-acetyltransferase [Clostridia bacterium]